MRTFHEADDAIAAHPDVLRIIRAMADMVQEIRPGANFLRLNLHPMFVFADLMSTGDNSPEGIHQDGADYIISALVIERAGITTDSGESIVYDLDQKTVLFRRTLAEGEGLFKSDREVFHYVTPIREDPAIPPDFGHRSILGFDVEILS